ncbi:SIMPL domain-containing protein [Kiritimatiella glycovorans]|uniref:SIMPL domain-containing protein n=1 Tax=Kiritimatiella glycovorans TaxID=1307763 RepID=A0A0G3EI55_9BACT|nr:SIMPL domain-containing protein [Kiritimatiella glycovorans]AKJ65122.1 hypothetical protein L21SP4_01886 [Kiritimatiella glycovorans]
MRGRWIAACVLIAAAAAPVSAQETITVSGRAESLEPADTAFVSMYVIGTGEDMSTAAEDADMRLRDVLDALPEAGGNTVRERTVFDVWTGAQPVDYFTPVPQDALSQPQVIRRILLETAPERTAIFGMIDDAMYAGARMELPAPPQEGEPGVSTYKHNLVVYGLRDAASAEEALRAEALEEARARAGEMAAEVGRDPGGITRLRAEYHGRSLERDMEIPLRYSGTDADRIRLVCRIEATFALKAREPDAEDEEE